MSPQLQSLLTEPIAAGIFFGLFFTLLIPLLGRRNPRTTPQMRLFYANMPILLRVTVGVATGTLFATARMIDRLTMAYGLPGIEGYAVEGLFWLGIGSFTLAAVLSTAEAVKLARSDI